MAIYIPIKKEQEDEANVVYAYGVEIVTPAQSQFNRQKQRYEVSYKWGSFSLEKSSGEIGTIIPAIGDEEKRNAMRAICKVHQHWEAAEFPEETCYAA